MFTLQFDMRAPDWPRPAADLYAAAIDMCAWTQTRGAVLAVYVVDALAGLVSSLDISTTLPRHVFGQTLTRISERT